MKKLFVIPGIILALSIISGADLISAQQRPNPQMRCEDNFAKMDTDKDGQVSLKEFLAAKHQRGNTEALFKAKDKNNDSFLSKDEFCSTGRKQGSGRGKGRVK